MALLQRLNAIGIVSLSERKGVDLQSELVMHPGEHGPQQRQLCA